MGRHGEHGLAKYVANLDEIEREIGQVLADLGPQLSAQHAAAQAAERWADMTRRHRTALEGRIEASPEEAPSRSAILPLRTGWQAEGGHGAGADALHILYGAFNHAALGYVILHAVAHRAFDSQDEGNTADLAESHLRDYAVAAQEINQLISDIVVRELSDAGIDCQCQCPACGLGVCLCAPHGTNTVNQAWRDTTPEPTEPGIVLRPPRAGSAAVEAGLREGDRLAAVDDAPIASDLDTAAMQAAVRKRVAGEELRIRVLRGTDTLDIPVRRG